MRPSILLAVLTTASPALAASEDAGPERAHSLLLSIDRLIGVSYMRYVHVDGQEDYATDLGFFSVGGSRPRWEGGGETIAIHTAPRLGLDGLVLERFTAGGSVAFWSGIADGPTSILLNPRIGYFFSSGIFAVWPRIGVSYYRSGVNREESGVYLTAEAPFLVFPNEWMAITFGPVGDIPLTDIRDERRDYRAEVLHAGFMGGIVLPL